MDQPISPEEHDKKYWGIVAVSVLSMLTGFYVGWLIITQPTSPYRPTELFALFCLLFIFLSCNVATLAPASLITVDPIARYKKYIWLNLPLALILAGIITHYFAAHF
jgi:general stress protein CsbA